MRIIVLIGVLLLFIGAGCQSFNHGVRNDFPDQEPMRHGIIPLPHPANTKAPPPPSEGSSNKKAVITLNEFDYPLDEGSVARGKVLYQKNCISCHGDSGKGDGPRSGEFNPPPPNLTLLAKEVPNFQFFMMVSRYQGDMPGWDRVFSQNDIKDLEHYLRSLSRFKE